MRHPILQILLFAILPSGVLAQANQDTIFTYEPDTIVCTVDHMDEDYVYYKYYSNQTSKDLSRISKDQISSVFENNKRYYDLSKITASTDPANTEEKNTKLVQGGGIIYESYLDSPPIFRGGETDLILYLQNNMVNQSQSSQIYGQSLIKVLFEATINTDGMIQNVVVSQASVNTSNVDEETKNIENQLLGVVAQMPTWTPAVYNGENVSVSIYIPIQFRIESNAIILYSGSNAFVFSNMNY